MSGLFGGVSVVHPDRRVEELKCRRVLRLLMLTKAKIGKSITSQKRQNEKVVPYCTRDVPYRKFNISAALHQVSKGGL
ncbi:MAG: hypothetical protein KIG47_07905, partial [Prevotellamassilia sp.]|nr:hypothetical protein [Prevotellamassilia sp.]